MSRSEVVLVAAVAVAGGRALAQESPASAAEATPAAPRRAASTSQEQQALADVVDAELAKAWSAQKLHVAAPADDATWLRRVSVDLRGTLPTLDEVTAFLADGDPAKRSKQVDAFLADRRFAENLAVVWTDLLLANAGKNAGRMQQWLETWLQEQFEQGATMKDVARHVLADTAWTLKPGPLSFLLSYHDTIEVASGVTARAFLGLQIQCAQCHDHPFDHWKRDDFNRFTSFFADVRADHLRGGDPLFRVLDRDPEWDLEDRLRHLLQASRRAASDGAKPSRAKSDDMKGEMQRGEMQDDSLDVSRGMSDSAAAPEGKFDESGLLEVLELCGHAPKGESPFAALEAEPAKLTALLDRLPSSARELVDKYREHRTLFHEAAFLDGKPYERKEGCTKRSALAEWVVDPANPWFGPALTNRVWGHVFGRGLVDPVDDLSGSQDRILPPLLERVAGEFVAHETDPRFLIGALVRTKAYALGNALDADLAECERAERWCAAHPIRCFTAYEMANALVAVVAPEEGRGSRADRQAASDRERRKLADTIASYFGGKDGASEGNAPSIPQSLFLMNGAYAERPERFGRGKVLDQFLDASRPESERLRDVFYAALARPPTAAEVAAATKLVGSSKGGGAGVEDVLWALLNSTEFRSNR